MRISFAHFTLLNILCSYPYIVYSCPHRDIFVLYSGSFGFSFSEDDCDLCVVYSFFSMCYQLCLIFLLY